MDKEKFLQLYWRNYISLEKEFIRTLECVTLDNENYRTFSTAYIKLLLQIGSEIDIDAELLCRMYNKNTKLEDIDDYRREIKKSESDFCDTEVCILQYCNISSFKPWNSWKKEINPNWWRVYNKVKHERMGRADLKMLKRKIINLLI